MFVFGGDQDLMPPEEEGPSTLGRKDQKDQQQQQNDEAALLEAMAKRRERDAAVAKYQMQAALASKSGAGRGDSWGILDNGDDVIDALSEVDWRAYALSNTLSDKQQKLADKIRNKESRIEHLSREIENIRAKQGNSVEELSLGQATTVMRNEGSIEVARQEIEEFEDLLCDSIRSANGGGRSGKGKKRKPVDNDDDTVWDRTEMHKKKKNGGGVDNGMDDDDDDDDDGALDVATLMARKETLIEEKEKIEMDQVKEEAKKNGEKKKEEGGGGGGNEDDSDALDAFMSGLKTTMAGETVDSLKKQLDGINKEIDEVERMIKIADPDGWYNIEKDGGGSGSDSRRKRLEDVLRAKKKLQEQQGKMKRKRVEEEEKRKEAVERMKREQNEEEEEEEGKRREQVMAMMMDNSSRKEPVGNIHRMEGEDSLVGGLQTMKKIDEAGEAMKQKMEGRRADIAAKLSAMKGELKGEKWGDRDRGGGDDVTASVLADLALLRGATAGYGAMADDEGRE